jgi:hypothetical protein
MPGAFPFPKQLPTMSSDNPLRTAICLNAFNSYVFKANGILKDNCVKGVCFIVYPPGIG